LCQVRFSPFYLYSIVHFNLFRTYSLTDAATLSKIQVEVGVTAVWKESILTDWLQKKNPIFEDMSKAVERFSLSCAAFCVATYVLGVGDRHNDNIMLAQDGRLFHIDFGHFLGNVKKKLGIKRERTPFILTSDFVHVMEWGQQAKAQTLQPGDIETTNFGKFIETSASAFLVLRRNAPLFLGMLQLVNLSLKF